VSGPGDTAPKRPDLGQSTQSFVEEDQDAAPIRVDVALCMPPESEEFGTLRKSSVREPGYLGVAAPMVGEEQPREDEKSQAVVESAEESDAVVVPEKLTKTRVTPVEPVEGRAAAKGKSAARNAPPAQDGQGALTALQRIGERAKQKPKEKWTNLLSHIKVPLLKEAYQRLKKKAAPGVDEVTWAEYGERLDERLRDLQDRVHRGSYHPQPVKRVLIPKSDGKTRPLGLTALEDKVVQQAARMVLEPIYEAEFIGFSYGFRPKRSAHQALDAVAESIQRKVNWVLDADIRAYFDTIDHGHLQRFIEHRIGDSRMVHLLMRWVKAGVLEGDELHAAQEGTPQGAIISPLLANLYLHYVFDLWICQWRRRQAQGEVYAVRYADDLLLGFQKEEDARTLHSALAERLGQFGLELHPDKTRVIEFGRSARGNREQQGQSKPETFEFLGFTHICGTSRAGKFQLKRRTSRKKRRAKMARLKEEARRRRHHRVAEQHAWLSQVLEGHYRYYGVPTNYHALAQFQRAVSRMWHRSLQRRSQRGRWSPERLKAFEQRLPLPSPRIYHPWPAQRFAHR
jgi:RNA-directed DNA polymerase